MSKSILVIDTPNSCSECELCSNKRITVGYFDEFHQCLANKEIRVQERYEDMENSVVFDTKEFNFRNERHPQCPLQPTDELLEELEVFEKYTKSFMLNSETIIKHKTAYNKLYKALGGKVDE